MDDKNPKNATGYTPLHMAAQRGNLSICKLITNTNSDQNPKTVDGLTPFHAAAQNGHFEVCKWFF